MLSYDQLQIPVSGPRSFWKRLQCFVKELVVLIQGTEVTVSRVSSQIVLHLRMLAMNYSGSDSCVCISNQITKSR